MGSKHRAQRILIKVKKAKFILSGGCMEHTRLHMRAVRLAYIPSPVIMTRPIVDR